MPPTYRHAATSSRAAAAAQYSRDDEGESDEEAESSKVSHAQSLKRGTQVTIHRTENVQQRAPHLIGRIGTIKEVPQHPNTWFKVQFADRRVCTFRPSALRRVANGGGGEGQKRGGKPGKPGKPGKDGDLALSDDEGAGSAGPGGATGPRPGARAARGTAARGC